MTVSGPVKKGPNGYTYWLFFENEREEYIKSKGAAPTRDWKCDVRFAV
jgi:hemolysin-activating ACP:hemolysin acyltransferase